jgi:D-psicose/D-tagatose/L-ribulose 3-epimerase
MRITVAAVLSAFALAPAPAPATAAKVQVGYCTSLKNVDAAKAAGFDYVEVSATEAAAMTDADFAAAAAHAKQVGMPTPAANLFVPQAIKVVGPDANVEQQTAHVRKVMERLSTLGVEVLVFGSGGARRVPDGFDRAQAWTQLVDFSRRAAVEAQARHITVAIEPLRKEETNIINTAAEGLRLVEAVNHPNFQLMIDFFHLASEHEDPAIVVEAKDHLRHLHMANPNGRVFPQQWGEFDYAPFFAKLKAIGYDQRISMEGSTTDLATQGPITVALLRKAFE